jgi:GNAT superfamily N-acetyltransferase
MDKAQLSRILTRLVSRGAIRRRPDPANARRLLLSLTAAGKRAFAALEASARAEVEAMIAPLSEEARERLVADMSEIGRLLGEAAPQPEPVILRPLEPGDLGHVARRQAMLYVGEHQWDWTFEGLVCGILGEFVAGYDSEREGAWIAEQGGDIVGSVFLCKTADPKVAKLRLLYVEKSARGSGVGTKLVSTCIERAKACGYATLTLWTNDVLVSARRIYETAGFRLVASEPHHSFGRDLVGQTWTLDLMEPSLRGA